MTNTALKAQIDSQITNETATGGITTYDVVTNINNNPVRGKVYTGFGQDYPLNFQNSAVTNISVATRADNGFMEFPYTNAAAMTNEMVQALQKPPPFYRWTGMVSNKYITVQPGQIQTSKIVKSYRMNLNKWIQMCIPYLKNSPEGNRLNIRYLGKSAFFGLEKMLDSRTSEPDIRIAYEINVTTSAVAQYTPRIKMNPVVVLQPVPISYGP